VTALMTGASSVRAHVIAADLARAGADGMLVNAVERLSLEIDILVNNAGYDPFFHDGGAGRCAHTLYRAVNF
jgi:short-subunit dehydrogenase